MLTHGSMTLVYDGDGNRISETNGGTTTKFLVDDHNPTGLSQVIDELVNGSVTRTYAYGLQRISENQQISGTWTPSFYGYDGHGNVRFLANASGAITDSYDFDAFGMPIRTTGATSNPFFYSGERLDTGIGIYDLRARYYDQSTGRFWSMDPYQGRLSRPSTLHKYAYTANNPVNFVDPTGRGVFETATLSFKLLTIGTVSLAVLAESLEWAFECKGHEVASAGQWIVPPPPPELLRGPGGPYIGPAPPASPNTEPCTVPTHDESPSGAQEGDPRGPARTPEDFE